MQPTLRCLQEATSASGRRGRGDCLVLIPVALRFRHMSISRWEEQTIGTLVPMVLIVRITTFTVIKKRVAGTGCFLSIKTATSASGRRGRGRSWMLWATFIRPQELQLEQLTMGQLVNLLPMELIHF